MVKVIVDDEKLFSHYWITYNQAQTREKVLFMKLLHDLCKTIENPKYDYGRPTLSLSDIIFCSVFKVYSLYSGRRFTSDIKIAKHMGFIEKTPHYNSIFNYLKKSELTSLLMELIEVSSLPLKDIENDFAIDSSGFSTSRFSRWSDYKYRKKKKIKNWVKVHLICGVKTKIVTSVIITEPYSSDSIHLPMLVETTSTNFNMEEVSADKAYSSRSNLEFIDSLGAKPFIPFKSNVKEPDLGDPIIWRKMWYMFNYNREYFDNHYHKRSNSETVFHMIKSKFGDSLRCRKKRSQINEVLCKIICHNICVLIRVMYKMRIIPNF